jgi:Leucine-rich repeat (LRR) protein
VTTDKSAPSIPPKPRRRWLQFSLRSLLVLLAVLGVGFGWFAYTINRARERREAQTAICKLGGWIDYESAPAGLTGKAMAWLESLAGEELFLKVTEIDFIQAPVTDADLAHLRRVTEVQTLWLASPTITDAGLEHLRPLSQLKNLSIGFTDITDAGLEHLRGLTRLEALSVRHTAITDVGLEHLRGLAELRYLELNHTQIADSGLIHLQRLGRLEVLELSDTKVTDAGLRHLRGLMELQSLWLDNTQVTDAGVAELQQALPNCHITR